VAVRTLLAVVYWLACAVLTFTLWASGMSFLNALLLGFIAPAAIVIAFAVWRHKRNKYR
jgi:hypothetical protein